MNNETLNKLIKLYEDQITQLEAMSKIELGDDVIDEINKLKNALKKETQKQLLIEIMNEDAKDGLYKKQTTVEWLFHQLWEEPKDKFTWYAILEKAKEMDKKQREDLIIFSKEMCTSHAHAEYIVNEFNKKYEKPNTTKNG